MNDLVARLDLPEAHLHAMDLLLKSVPPIKYSWALTGSASLRLQGVDVPVHDLDIQILFLLLETSCLNLLSSPKT